MNMQIPVGVMARLIPFHDAIIVYFCRAVSGSRGSGAAGGGGSLGPNALLPSAFPLAASFPNSQPISFDCNRCLNCILSVQWRWLMLLHKLRPRKELLQYLFTFLLNLRSPIRACTLVYLKITQHSHTFFFISSYYV